MHGRRTESDGTRLMRALATGAPLGIRRHLRRGWGPAHAIDGFHAYRMYPFVYVDGRHAPSHARAWENTIRSAHWTIPLDGPLVLIYHDSPVRT